jgi:hypothetical protein
MFLIHAARVVNVCVDFANVVEITNRYLGRKISRIAFHITGEVRATVGRIRDFRGILYGAKRTFISVIS